MTSFSDKWLVNLGIKFIYYYSLFVIVMTMIIQISDIGSMTLCVDIQVSVEHCGVILGEQSQQE